MIVCHCNFLKSSQIRRAISGVLGQDKLGFVTPGVVFRKLGCRPNCGTCMEHFHRLISEELQSQTLLPAQTTAETEQLVKT